MKSLTMIVNLNKEICPQLSAYYGRLHAVHCCMCFVYMVHIGKVHICIRVSDSEG